MKSMNIIYETEIDNFLSVEFIKEYLHSVNEDSKLDFVLEALNTNLGKNLSKVTIRVYGNEGTIPHFHLISRATNFQTCIEIYRPLYFNHDNIKGFLSNEQCVLLNNYLGAPQSNGKTPWQEISKSWESANTNSYNAVITSTSIQPDYTKLNDSLSVNTGSKSKNKKKNIKDKCLDVD